MTEKELKDRLRLHLGHYASNADNLETLLWHVGELRRRADDAHSTLDRLGAPRFSPDDKAHPYTLLGRIERIP